MKRKIINFLLFVLLSVMALAEVPHTYVTDNPNSEVYKVETIKEREKAELNLSIRKVESKKVSGKLDEEKKQIIFSFPKEIKNLVVTENLEDLPNSSTVQGRKVLSNLVNNRAISSNLIQETEGNKLIVNYKNKPKNLYISDISDLNGNFYYWDGQTTYKAHFDSTIIFEIDDTYDGVTPFDGTRGWKPQGIKLIYADAPRPSFAPGTVTVEQYRTSPNIEIVSFDGNVDEIGKIRLKTIPSQDFKEWIQYIGFYWESGVDDDTMTEAEEMKYLEFRVVRRTLQGQSTLVVKEFYPVNQFVNFNSTTMQQGSPLALENSLRDVFFTTSGKGVVTMEQGDKLEIDGRQVVIGAGGNLPEQKATTGTLGYTYKVENGKLRLALNKWGVLEPDRKLMIRVWRNNSKVVEHTLTIKSPRRVEGSSSLSFKEYYPTLTYINFTGCTLNNPQSLALENSVRDVSLNSSVSSGIVLAEQGDKIEVNDNQYVVGAGGNLSEQQGLIGNINFKFKVENGKLRLALNKWGVLEPKRNLIVRVIRGTNEISKHTIGIISPRRVEGSSQLNYNNDYQIRTFVRFGGISLTAPGISSLETPVPAGVTLSAQAGQGIPFMNEGDILEVNDGVTRAVHQFTIGANGTLSKKQIKFNNSDVTLYVENGKLRAGLNNWIVNKPVKLNLRLIRGTNEIMNHAIGFKVPEAPFNIKENGLLDFGRVTAGSKRTAETNIVLEMLNDVDSVKFNLKDTQPVMENANGKQLKVNEIQTIVKKQGGRTYLVKLHGKLVIPEDTQMGEYSGSTILELRIK